MNLLSVYYDFTLMHALHRRFLRAEDGAGVVPDSSLHSIVIESCPLDQADYDAIMLPPLTLCASKVRSSSFFVFYELF